MQSDFTACQDCLCSRIRKASRAITQHYERYFRGSELRGTQFTLLATLIQTGPLPLTKLADMLGVERTTLTRNLKPLVEAKLVRASGAQDARIRNIEITKKGAAAARAALPRWQQAQANAQKVLARFQVSLK